jgi:NhaA family Na+:H+ antiporter
MTVFFFVIGLEIKGELVSGQLRHAREAAVPVIGALGGMVLPAALFLAFNLGGPGSAGWGVPMATDVAFAVGVLALLGSRVPAELRALLLGLAIIDDVGAILVIALVYSDGVELRALAVAAAGLGAVVVLRRAQVRYVPVYVCVGSLVWLATLESGVHATIAGVALGLLAPARPFLPEVDADRIADDLSGDEHVSAGEVRALWFRVRETIPVTERLQDILHPWSSYLIVPLFALANAGVPISATGLADAARSPVTLGVVTGLVVGKLVGVSGAILLATRLGRARLPTAVTTRHVIGLAGIAGIGFTVSLFITALAFEEPALTDEAKLGVLVASLLAALVGTVILRGSGASGSRTPAGTS